MNPEDITEYLNEIQLEILAEMLDEIPTSKEWIECHKKLSDEQLFKVHNKLGELIDRKEQQRINSMSKDDKEKDDEKWRLWYENADSNSFYGNMGQPVTLEDYKNRYGRYPVGYDENGNKI